jgi:UPF0755 protein
MRDFLRFVFLLLLILAIIVIGVSFYLIYFARFGPPPTAGGGTGPVEVVFEVGEGESTAQIARNLEDQGLIHGFLIIPADWLFRGWSSLRGMDGLLKAGRYTLRSDMTMDEILEALTKAPRQEEITFTIREGLRLEEIAEQMGEQGVVSAEEFKAALQQPYSYDFLADRPISATLEGYLFPDTYNVPRVYTATQIVDFILQNFDQKFTATMREEARQENMTVFQVVTLASIVEREAILDSERPTIASVYLNRLAAGMPLEADPTVQYALGYSHSQGRWWPVIYFDELGVDTLAEFDNPYNTYRYAGLPPGPICSPGLASLKAVVEPAQTGYYFFVAKGDGSGEHAFAKTLEEHNANVARYRPW